MARVRAANHVSSRWESAFVPAASTRATQETSAADPCALSIGSVKNRRSRSYSWTMAGDYNRCHKEPIFFGRRTASAWVEGPPSDCEASQLSVSERGTGFTISYPSDGRYVARFVGLSPARGCGTPRTSFGSRGSMARWPLSSSLTTFGRSKSMSVAQLIWPYSTSTIGAKELYRL